MKTAPHVYAVFRPAPAGPVLRQCGPVKAVAISPDGKWLATGGYRLEVDLSTKKVEIGRGEVVVYDVTTGRSRLFACILPGPVWSLAFSPNGQALLVGCEDGCARLYHAVTGQLLGRPQRHDGTVARVGFSPDGRLAWTAGWGGTRGAWHWAALWDMPDDVRHIRPLLGGVSHQDGRVLLSPTGDRLLLADRHGNLHQWNLTRFEQMRVLGPQAHPLAFQRDGRAFLTHNHEQVALWDTASGKPLGQWNIARVNAVVATDKGFRLFTLTPDGAGRIQDIPAGPVVSLALPTGKLVAPSHFLNDGRMLVTSSEDGFTQCWDTANGARLRARQLRAGTEWFVTPRDKQVFIASSHSRIFQPWDFVQDRPVGRPLMVEDMKVTASFGGRLALVGENANARLWHLPSGRTIGPRIPVDGQVQTCLSADGKTAVVYGPSSVLYVWSIPEALPGGADHLRLWAEAVTGQELDEQGAVRDLTPQARAERLKQLEPAESE